ncbi:MAG: hypothetical protein ABMA01_17035 [Chthoniobacteraceae bacterium]
MSLYRIARVAQGDLDEIWVHIGSFAVNAADHWFDSLERRSTLLTKQRRAGQARPDLAAGERVADMLDDFVTDHWDLLSILIFRLL